MKTLSAVLILSFLVFGCVSVQRDQERGICAFHPVNQNKPPEKIYGVTCEKYRR